MSVEEYHVIPHCPGWKHEYWDGHLRLSPNHRVIVYSRPTDTPLPERPSKLEARFLLDLEPGVFISAFTDSFEGTMDFVDQARSKVEVFAQKYWRKLQDGARGTVHLASGALLSPGTSPRLLSLMTFVERDPGEVLLDCVFTRPEWQGDGLATTLLARALPVLHQTGHHTIWSGVFEGNTASCAWHERNGFVVAPDLMHVTSTVHRLRQEIWRCEQLGRPTHDLHAKFEAAQALEVALEARAEAEGFAAVSVLEKIR